MTHYPLVLLEQELALKAAPPGLMQAAPPSCPTGVDAREPNILELHDAGRLRPRAPLVGGLKAPASRAITQLDDPTATEQTPLPPARLLLVPAAMR